MHARLLLGSAAGLGAITVGAYLVTPASARLGTTPDLIVGRIETTINDYGTVGGISAYAIGTTSCNNGDTLLAWIDSGAQEERHPVIAQNFYRLKDGRFEMIGMSWVKHGFCAADSFVCGSCTTAGGCDWLGIGCSDIYTANNNGGQSYLGPRSEVDPVTGEFNTYPPTAPSGNATLRGRLLVDIDDLDPAQNAGATYYAEGQYIHIDDAASTPHNNTAWRPVSVGSLSGGIYNLTASGSTEQEEVALHAWKVAQPTVTIVNTDVPADGRYVLAYDVTDNGDGTWHYEYALFNMNSGRAVRSFDVPVDDDVTVTSVGFHDVTYHSGESFSGADWTTPGDCVWETETHAVNPDANALRWGTCYNFRFDADFPPTTGDITLGLFVGGGTHVISGVAVPLVPGELNGDGVVNVLDLIIMLTNWGAIGPSPSDSDLNHDGFVNVLDLLIMLENWG